MIIEPSDYPEFDCVDCSVNTLQIDEYYMIQFELWEQTGLGPHDGMLCIGCVEKRLGRDLTPADFLECPLNAELGDKSERLMLRLGRPT